MRPQRGRRWGNDSQWLLFGLGTPEPFFLQIVKIADYNRLHSIDISLGHNGAPFRAAVMVACHGVQPGALYHLVSTFCKYA